MDFEKMLAEMRKLQAQQKNSKQAFEENLQILSEVYGYDKELLREQFEIIRAKQRARHRAAVRVLVGIGGATGWAISSYQMQSWSLPDLDCVWV